jgi:rod shape-determining protein MreB and related proteins
MKKDIIGIDLGSANTVVYSSLVDSIVFSEPTLIALDSNTHEVKDIGYLASKIQGKAPYNYDIVSPIVNGAIADEDAAYLFLSRILSNLHLGKNFRTTTLVFSAPSKLTPVCRNAIIDIGKRLSVKEIFIESQAKLAALGTGDNVNAPTATLVANIGAGVSDIALLSLGEIVAVNSTFIAGASIDEAIRRYMIQNQHLDIGIRNSEYIKMRVADIAPNAENRLAEIKGRDTITSLPSSVIVSSGEIRKTIEPLIDFIGLKITDVIGSVSPDLVSDLMKNGLILTGGGALLRGLKDYLQNLLSIPVRVADKPAEAVTSGIRYYARTLK